MDVDKCVNFARMQWAYADTMFVNRPAGASVVNDLLAALCRQELISLDVGASLGDGLHPDDLMPQQVGVAPSSIRLLVSKPKL